MSIYTYIVFSFSLCISFDFCLFFSTSVSTYLSLSSAFYLFFLYFLLLSFAFCLNLSYSSKCQNSFRFSFIHSDTSHFLTPPFISLSLPTFSLLPSLFISITCVLSSLSLSLSLSSFFSIYFTSFSPLCSRYFFILSLLK
jgi:hypothetical protein